MPKQSSMNVGGIPECNIPSRTIFTGDEVLDPRKPINWQDVKGDNLKVMRGINSNCIDLIYLDPPFNSNRAYEAPVGSKAAGAMFRDAWTLDDLDVEWLGGIAEENPRVYSVITASRLTNGRGMQSYLCMMAIRLMEMYRILKPTGSIYLHCDPTAGHYLKLLMDAIFGAEHFLSEIVWKRTSAHSDTRQGRRQHGRIHDSLLFYSKGDNWTWNPIFTEYDQDYVDNFYRHIEPETGRRYRLGDLTGPGGSSKGNPHYEVLGVTRYWRYSRKRMQELIEEGRIVQTRPGAVPQYKRYLDEMPGVPLQDQWTDIKPIQSQSKERIGYPTQKPLALLERIIKASSDEGDIVLDPFCGCATALVAAEKLERQWIGIDLSPKAVDLVITRLKQDPKTAIFSQHVIRREDYPLRTDQGRLPPVNTYKRRLFGEQEGVCALCEIAFPFRNFTIDHKIPVSHGGTDHYDNLQLLCGACNSVKSDKLTTEQARHVLRARGVIK